MRPGEGRTAGRWALGLLAAGAVLLASTALPGRAAADQSGELVGRINEYRSAIGAPALQPDPLIAQAALNHSTYWTLNSEPSGPLGYHEESPGTPGYTGAYPPQRCEAVGTSCDGEVMTFGWTGTTAVDVLMDTVYHRQLILSPFESAAGGDWANTITTIDFRGNGSEAPVPASGFPVGKWDGPLVLLTEWPDPVAACNAQSSAPPIEHSGTPITWQLPGQGETTSFEIHRVAGGPSLDGCTEFGYAGGFFLPAAALEPFTEYEATVGWQQPSGGEPGPPQVLRWRFTTGDGEQWAGGGGYSTQPQGEAAEGRHRGSRGGAPSARPRLASARLASRRGRPRLILRLRGPVPLAARLKLLRGGRSLLYRRFGGAALARRRLVVPLSPRLAAGVLVLRLALTDRQGNRQTVTRRLHPRRGPSGKPGSGAAR